jgi:hypothetical protein
LALATLTILLGVGAFISWAMTHHLLGPEARIGLGALLAAALAAAGWRLRRTPSPQFGSILLGLALAVVHVDAWGAGPRLHLVPIPLALGAATLASVALSIFARAEGEQALFAVGVGGALLAPFVTSDGHPHIVPFMIYGYAVIAFALAALRDSEWPVAAWLLAAGTMLYVGTCLATNAGIEFADVALAPSVLALAVAATAVLVLPLRSRYRLNLSLTTLAILAISAAARRDAGFAVAQIVIAALGTVTAYAAIWRHDATELDGPSFAGAVVLPLALMSLAMAAAQDHRLASSVAVVWSAMAVIASLLDQRGGARRHGAHQLVAGLAGGASIIAGLGPNDITAAVIALATYGTVLALLVRPKARLILLAPAALALIAATGWTFLLLNGRPDYQYTPFATSESLAGFAVSAAWVTVAWHVTRIRPEVSRYLTIVSWLIPLLWGRIELAGAISPDTAMFCLIAYYAAIGVAAVFIGRARALPRLRHAGLALAIYATIKAIVQASELAIGLRIGSYFVAGAFMLSVAYWYRARKDETATTAPPRA